MRNEDGKILGRLLFVASTVLALWAIWALAWPKYNLQKFGSQLEYAVNQELTQLGITDHDVLRQTHKEHGWPPLVWVQTERTIQVPQDRSPKIAAALSRLAQRSGCSVEKVSLNDGVDITIKRWLWDLQQIKLLIVNPRETPHGEKAPRVAFVIDDVAYESESMDRFAALGVPFTFAILPRDKHSKDLSHKAKSLDFAVMLHLPMEPKDLKHNDPGPSGLFLKMSEQELKAQFDRDVASVPNIAGINNHMGSAFTENEDKMALVMKWVKKTGYLLSGFPNIASLRCLPNG